MSGVDAARDKMRALVAEIQSYDDTIFTEQDTRIKVIDRVLVEVLGWTYAEISTESRAGVGYVDYKCAIDGRAKLVVEAKRDGRELGLAQRAAGHAYRLRDRSEQSSVALEGIRQAITYCGFCGAELACVTNGKEWLVFRGNRLADGTDVLDGKGVAFPTLQSTVDNFDRFYDLLGAEGVHQLKYRAIVQQLEGTPVRIRTFSNSVHSAGDARFIEPPQLGRELREVMQRFFTRLSGKDDPEMLAKCFVTSEESAEADRTLLRIAEELRERVGKLQTAEAHELTTMIEDAQRARRHEFILLIGTKGAGQSTFIDRFFRLILPDAIKPSIVLINIDLRTSDGDAATVVQWLNRHVIEEAEDALFGANPDDDDMQGMFFDLYTKWKNIFHKHLYETDKTQFKIKFGEEIYQKRESDPQGYIRGLVRHITRNRQKLPVFLFDNADHFGIDLQEKVFQYARSFFEQEICLVILPITDRTSWQLAHEGPMRSFESRVLWLPTPHPRDVLEKRITYLTGVLEKEKRRPGHYVRDSALPLSLENLPKFVASLQRVFLETGETAEWIGKLSNWDIRQCLEHAESVVCSPHLPETELLKAYIDKTSHSLDPHLVTLAIVRGHYNIYCADRHKFVRNIFDAPPGLETTPLLCLRLLMLLNTTREQARGAEEPFVEKGQLIQYFVQLQLDESSVVRCLEYMLQHGLCYGYDPRVSKVGAVNRVRITPSGEQHLEWGTGNRYYVLEMLGVTPLRERRIYNDLRAPRVSDQKKLSVFIGYLLVEDEMYCRVPIHDSYANQRELVETLQSLMGK